MKLPLLALLLLPLAVAAQNPALVDNTEADWQAMLALETGPRQMSAEPRSREQARTVALGHLARQEAALRAFLQQHPASSHTVDARLRLARLLATRSDLTGNATEFEAALRLLASAVPSAPEERRADLEFARIALTMHRLGIPSDRDRDALESQILAFQAHYPGDRRVAPALAEIAALFDAQPRHKEELLRRALAAAQTPEVRARIDDDLRRLALLGRPIAVRGTAAGGMEIDLANLRGRVVLVYFFAGWSAPSIAGLDEVEYLRATFAREKIEVIGVSLDPTRAALDALMKARKISWPVIFDGNGWKGPLVRSLGINALPTLWIVDRRGNLRTLNARTESEALVRELLKEPA